jgi:hypothetical protein
MVTIVKPVSSDKEQLDRLRAAGFEVKAIEGNRYETRKGNCAGTLARGAKLLEVASQPGYVLGGEVTHLLDQGFQKFLAGPTKKFPAHADQLKELHHFQEELLAALGAVSLYNTSLGTISESYHYDRVKGRPNP